MAKTKNKFVCQECGYTTPRGLGRCPSCQTWNSFTEETEVVETSPLHRVIGQHTNQPEVISNVSTTDTERLLTDMPEFDRVLGGGIVLGSVILIGGDPGIGKSTLLLQASDALSRKYGDVLYVTGEESVNQTKLRSTRLGVTSESLYVLCENNLQQIEKHIENLQPKAVVVDSIQAVFLSDFQSAPGSITQIRECAAQLLICAKNKNIPIFLVGHVTKEGTLAGPRVLEHIVDTVLYFEGERHHIYRVLRAIKNRFGSTNELGIFEMQNNGLVDVKNPSQLFLSEREEEISGSVVVSSMEGTRPLLLEVQALVVQTHYGTPRNTATGIDRNRVALLIAVLNKRIGLDMGDSDVFVNITGGLRVDEPGIDLGVLIAIISNHRNIPIDSRTVIIGEVGLGGEIRPVPHIETRIREAAKLGFTRAIFPDYHKKGLEINEKIDLIGVKNIYDSLSVLL
ncbi:MAG: DNA repair protein RadA [Candidatus Poribacteria bacterium]|nr:DNA repair protein RadA [Candidatus Poribacteria bacterium]